MTHLRTRMVDVRLHKSAECLAARSLQRVSSVSHPSPLRGVARVPLKEHSLQVLLS